MLDILSSLGSRQRVRHRTRTVILTYEETIPGSGDGKEWGPGERVDKSVWTGECKSPAAKSQPVTLASNPALAIVTSRAWQRQKELPGAIHEEARVKIGSGMFAGFPNDLLDITRRSAAPRIKTR